MPESPNPHESSELPPVRPQPPPPQPGGQPGMSGRESYNVVSDTVTGLNLRLRDNLLQGGCILVCILLGAGLGAISADERLIGAFFGGFLGMIVGVFASGIFLMIYRAVRHLRGRHD